MESTYLLYGNREKEIDKSKSNENNQKGDDELEGLNVDGTFSDGQQQQQPPQLMNVVSTFLNSVIPNDIIEKVPTWSLYFRSILRHHKYFSVFMKSSLRNTRVLRFTSCVISMLVILCIDTTITYIFYKSHKEAFYIIVMAMITILISIPICFFFDYILCHYCMRRPDFARWGFTANSWLFQDKRMHLNKRSPLNLFFRSMESNTKRRSQMNEQYYSAEHEAEVTISTARAHLKTYCNDFDEAYNDSLNATMMLAKQQVIEKMIGIYPDGREVPLSIWDRLLYGSLKNKLVSKIRYARKKASNIKYQLLQEGDCERYQRDAILTQSFVLEFFPPFERNILRRNFSFVSLAPPIYIDPTKWLLSCAFILCSMIILFFVFMQWAVEQSDHTLNFWIIIFGTALAEDAFLVQPFRAVILHSLSETSIKPQLQSLQWVLTTIAISYTYGKSNPVIDSDIIQSLSPSCRAARLKVTKDLAIATLLQSINDIDVYACKDKSTAYVSIFVDLFTRIPTMISKVSEVLGVFTFEMMIPVVVSFYVIAHYSIVIAIEYFIIIPYIALTFGLCYHIWMRRRHSQKIKMEWYSIKYNALRIGAVKWLDGIVSNIEYVWIYFRYFTLWHQISDDNTINSWSILNQRYENQGKLFNSSGSSSSHIAVDRLGLLPGITDETLYLYGRKWLYSDSVGTGVSSDVSGGSSNRREINSDKIYITTAVVPSAPKSKMKILTGAQRYKRSHRITTDPILASTQMLNLYKYSIGSKDMQLVDETGRRILSTAISMNHCNVLAYVKDLIVLLRFVWTVYHPCGIVLGSHEISEIIDEFIEWSNRNGHHDGTLKSSGNMDNVSINLNSFHHWFLKINFEYLSPHIHQFVEDGIVSEDEHQNFLNKLSINSSYLDRNPSVNYQRNLRGEDGQLQQGSRNDHIDHVDVFDNKQISRIQQTSRKSALKRFESSKIDNYDDDDDDDYVSKITTVLRFDQGPEVKAPDDVNNFEPSPLFIDNNSKRKKSSTHKRVTFVDTLPDSNDDVLDNRYPMTSSLDQINANPQYYSSINVNSSNQHVNDGYSSNNGRYPSHSYSNNISRNRFPSSSSSPSSSFDYMGPQQYSPSSSSSFNMSYQAFPPPPSLFSYNSYGHRYNHPVPFDNYQAPPLLPSSSSSSLQYSSGGRNSQSLVKEIVESIEGNLSKSSSSISNVVPLSRSYYNGSHMMSNNSITMNTMNNNMMINEMMTNNDVLRQEQGMRDNMMMMIQRNGNSISERQFKFISQDDYNQ